MSWLVTALTWTLIVTPAVKIAVHFVDRSPRSDRFYTAAFGLTIAIVATILAGWLSGLGIDGYFFPGAGQLVVIAAEAASVLWLASLAAQCTGISRRRRARRGHRRR